MNRSQDTVIDDDEETCPLCIEEFDLSDKNFRPCPCGYQICQFCFNSLKNTYEKSTCPNCRRPYDEKTIQYKIPTAEEFKLDQLNKNKKQAAAKRKETEKREVESSSRRNLAGVRVKQQNLVYVIGLIPQIKDETALLQTLRGLDYFGQYGEIEKIVVSKTKPGAVNQGIGVYVTYARKEDAALCINTVDGSMNGERILRAQFGTTKYCSAYLRGETCNNKSCSFLHETGEDGQNSSLQNEPHASKPALKSTQSASGAPTRPQSTLQTTISQPMARQGSKEDSDSRKNSTDASALPSTASWANGNVNAPIVRARRASQAASRSTPSPQMTHASVDVQKAEESKIKESTGEKTSTAAHSLSRPKQLAQTPSDEMPAKAESKLVDPVQAIYDGILKSVASSDFRFVYDDSCLSAEDRAIVDSMPVMIDPYGGAKRRIMQDKEAAERAKLESDVKSSLEAQATSAAEEALDEDNMMTAGSLALGGEPEDNPRGLSTRGTIQRPNQPRSANNLAADQFASMTLNSRNHGGQQRQQLGQATSGNTQQTHGLPQPPGQNTAFEMSDFDRRGPQYSAAQYDQISNHQRHGSRYFNNNDSKGTTNSRFAGQQQSFYSSGVQGPPPGLPTARTPPVSGGGMFAHGQGFTNPGFGATKDSNTELHMRGRSGTNAGPEMSKRGGVEHLADTSIVQARIQQGGTTGQGLFGGNQVDDRNFPPLPIRPDAIPSALHSRVSSMHSMHSSEKRSSTPRVPPGFETTHAHPSQPENRHYQEIESQGEIHPKLAVPYATVQPAIPFVPIGQQTEAPKPKDLRRSREDHSQSFDIEPITNLQFSSAKESEKKQEATTAASSDIPQTLSGELKTDDGKTKSAQQQPNDEEMSLYKQNKLRKQKPSKIDISTAINASSPLIGAGILEQVSTPILDSAVVATPPEISSRPETPQTAASSASKVSLSRPRTLRLTTTTNQKAEATPSSAIIEKSVGTRNVPQTRSSTKQLSISSMPRSRPSSPSTTDNQLSRDVSRASSPPPSVIGSAPERAKSKHQQKKDRREKAKKSVEADEASSASGVAQPIEEVAPVIARQKKQKKRVESTTGEKNTSKATAFKDSKAENMSATTEKQDSSSSADNRKQSQDKFIEIPLEDQVKSDAFKAGTPYAEPPDEHAQVQEVLLRSYTLRDLYNNASKVTASETSNPVQKLLNENVAPINKILSSMIASDDLSKDHPWFNPPSFNSPSYKLPPDSRRGQEYLDGNGYSSTDAFGYVYLPQKEKRVLYAGHAVSVADSGDRKDDLLRRCLITPNGWVMRHLSADDSEKVLELEERRAMYAEDFGDVGTMNDLGVLEQDDFINLGGGIQELGRHGDRHGLCWVLGDDHPNGSIAAAAAAGEDTDIFDDLDDEDDDAALDSEGLSDGDIDDRLGLDLDTPNAGWDTPGRSGADHANRQSNTLRAAGTQIRDNQNPTLNIRTMDLDSLQKRVTEKQKELEVAKKEMDKMEKIWSKRAKEVGRFRDVVLKAS